jgi:hypothetical protein
MDAYAIANMLLGWALAMGGVLVGYRLGRR